MVEAVKTPFPVGELVDIAPLIAPGIDWSVWLETAFWILAGLLILVFLLYVMGFLYRPFLFKWQLVRLQKDVSAHQTTISKSEIAKLYHWFIHYQTWLSATKHPAMQVETFKAALHDLREGINVSCFSNQSVSRETYLDLISTAQSILKQNAQFSAPFSPLKELKLRFKNVKNKVAAWKR
ncbi:MAG: hypothetical protein JXK16_05245 [Thiotrichales bacterium]|nr:hypothetical protein [Thiotrichales bacterium]